MNGIRCTAYNDMEETLFIWEHGEIDTEQPVDRILYDDFGDAIFNKVELTYTDNMDGHTGTFIYERCTVDNPELQFVYMREGK